MAPEYFYPLLGMTFALSWGLLATFRWYLKERLRASSTAPSVEEGERLTALETRIGELEERVDFTERLLAQYREKDRLGPGA